MENYDPKLAARVWQRVQSGQERPAAPERNLTPWIAAELSAAATCMLLSRRFRARPAAMLKQMAQQAQAHAACLKGIHHLQTGTHARVQPSPPEQATTEVLLRRCYSQKLQTHSQYDACRSDPEYGQVFSRLAREEQEHCRLLLQLLGSLPEHTRS